LDKDDRFGWKFIFETGVGVQLVEKATSYRTANDFAGGEKFIESLRRIPSKHFTLEQKQVLDIAQYALYRKDTNRIETCKALLRRVLSLGRDTIWGQCALGYLILSGEKIETRPLPHASVRQRQEKKARAQIPFPLSDCEKILSKIECGKSLSENQKSAIARYAVLRRIGKEGWDELNSRQGADDFIKLFFSDRKWMEDFVWSGKCDNWAKALLALESAVYQDNGRWVKRQDSTGRRFATALALSHFDKDEAWIADMLDAYRSTALSKRLHKLALDQDVWKWRIALNHTMSCSSAHGTSKYYKQYIKALPQQQRFLDYYVNLPLAQYAGTCWIVPYRSFNCFGENVQGRFYYESWLEANESTLRQFTPQVGGVCGELSKFGSGCGNAHGLPSGPVGQPYHCALTRRLPNGKWEINYSVDRGTGFCSILPFYESGSYTYHQAHEGTFEGEREKRFAADRCLELAFLAQSKQISPREIARHYADACTAWPHHYVAWRLRSDWIVGAKRPLSEHKIYVNECAGALKGWRQPLWDILSTYFSRVAKEQGTNALADEIVSVMPQLRQGEDLIQEEGFFDRALSSWTKPLKSDISLIERVVASAFAAQRGTIDYFPQTISWSIRYFEKDEALFSKYVTLLERVAPANGGEKNVKVDFGSIILSSSKSGNTAVYRQATELQRKFSKPKVSSTPYPKQDFGGMLVSADGMLKTSSTSKWDSPRQYAFALDETPIVNNAFHTDKELEPWGMAVLAGPCRVDGVLVVNKCPRAELRGRQVPVEVQLSEDGKEWLTVFTDKKARDEYRVDLKGKNLKARFIRVRRTPAARDEVFHLNKILVYGKRLY
jgi:hypothetical protein